jgi:hypothetical protein
MPGNSHLPGIPGQAAIEVKFNISYHILSVPVKSFYLKL